MLTLEKKFISYKNTLTYQMLKIPNILCLQHSGLTPLTYMLRLESKTRLKQFGKMSAEFTFDVLVRIYDTLFKHGSGQKNLLFKQTMKIIQFPPISADWT